MFGELTAQGVPVHAEEIGSAAKVTPGTQQCPNDEPLLELLGGIFETDAFGDHFVYKLFE